MSITEEDIKKLTIGQLVKTLSIGAWIWIIVLLSTAIISSYKLGYKKGLSQNSHSEQEITLDQLSADQALLIKEIWRYQKENELNKVVISKDGVIFDDAKKQPTNINLISKTSIPEGDYFRFEQLILSIPTFFLKQIPETRWGSPYVVTVPEEARELLDE